MGTAQHLGYRSYLPIASNHFTRIFSVIHIRARIVSSMSTPGLLNNRYQIEGRIGSGGMAEVYRARDLMLERTVAIKLLREDFSQDPAFRERFRQEARAAANLSHPNIVTIHDFGFDDQQIFIVMEYIPGTDLKTILDSRGKLNVDETLRLIIQACAGVGYAHRAGLIHCDVKPHNMIVTPDQRLKVTDFGIARALASIHPQEVNNVVWGSPQYFSPEQASGHPPSPASDVYGLGVVLYEMLTGRLPFIANTAAELARMHRSVTPIPPSQLNPLIPANLEQACLKVLSKEPTSRYRTADQFGRVSDLIKPFDLCFSYPGTSDRKFLRQRDEPSPCSVAPCSYPNNPCVAANKFSSRPYFAIPGTVQAALKSRPTRSWRSKCFGFRLGNLGIGPADGDYPWGVDTPLGVDLFPL